MMTLWEMLHGKTITNAYDGRPDGSVLIRLDDRTELTVFAGTIRDDSDDDPIRIGVGAKTEAEAGWSEAMDGTSPTLAITSLCGCKWDARVDPDKLTDIRVQVDIMCATHATSGVRLLLISPANSDLLAACETHVRLEEIHRAQPQRGIDFEDSFAQMKAAIAKAQP